MNREHQTRAASAIQVGSPIADRAAVGDMANQRASSGETGRNYVYRFILPVYLDGSFYTRNHTADSCHHRLYSRPAVNGAGGTP